MKLEKARFDEGPDKDRIIPQTYYTPDRRFYIEKERLVGMSRRKTSAVSTAIAFLVIL